jgi:hypothetical protein
MGRSTTENRDARSLLIIAAVLHLGYFAYLTAVLDFNMMRSDVLVYCKESFNWSAPYSTWFLPAYSLTIALVRAVTLNLLPAIVLMSLVSGLFYLVSVGAVYHLARALDFTRPFQIALLFAVYPMVGLTYSVYPVADSMATAFLALCLMFFVRKQWLHLTLCAGLAMVTHKATWFFVPPLLIIAGLNNPSARRYLPFAAVPLAALMGAGALHHHDLFWSVRWSLAHLIASRGSLPVFDGIFGPLVSGSIAKIGRGLVVLTILILAVSALFISGRSHFWVGFAVALSVGLMCMLVNQYESWAVVRFSKLLLIPCGYFLWMSPKHSRPHKARSNSVFVVALVASVISNVLYGLYLVKFFREPL